MKKNIICQIHETINLLESITQNEILIQSLENAAKACINSIKIGNKILLAGNGGSAADAQHIAAEFVSRFEFDRSPLPALALTTDTSILTAVANDYGYAEVFVRQIKALGRKGDIFIAYSTSGKSKNILLALEQAKKMNMITIGMTGNQNNLMKEFSDYIFEVPSSITAKIQEVHLLLGHILCGLVERELFASKE